MTLMATLSSLQLKWQNAEAAVANGHPTPVDGDIAQLAEVSIP